MRHQSLQDQAEGRTPLLWMEESYVVSESVPIGRIYKVPTGENVGRWVWYIDSRGIKEPRHGIAESLEEAKTRFMASWEAVLRQRRG